MSFQTLEKLVDKAESKHPITESSKTNKFISVVFCIQKQGN